MAPDDIDAYMQTPQFLVDSRDGTKTCVSSRLTTEKHSEEVTVSKGSSIRHSPIHASPAETSPAIMSTNSLSNVEHSKEVRDAANVNVTATTPLEDAYRTSMQVKEKTKFTIPKNKQEAIDLIRMRKYTLRKACFFFERRTGSLGITIVWVVIGAWMASKSFISASEGSSIDLKFANSVFAVVQLFIVFCCLFGFIAICNNSPTITRYFANLATYLVLLETLQALCNLIFSVVWRRYIVAQCSYVTEVFWIDSSVIDDPSSLSTQPSSDCEKIGNVEIVLQAVRFLVTLVVSGYWAACIASYATSREKLARVMHLEEDPETLAYREGVLVPRGSLEDEELEEIARQLEQQGLHLTRNTDAVPTAPGSLEGHNIIRNVYVHGKRIEFINEPALAETFLVETGVGVAGIGIGSGLVEARTKSMDKASIRNLNGIGSIKRASLPRSSTKPRPTSGMSLMAFVSPTKYPPYYKPESIRRSAVIVDADEGEGDDENSQDEKEEDKEDVVTQVMHQPLSPDQDLKAEQARFRRNSGRLAGTQPQAFFSQVNQGLVPAPHHLHGSVYVVVDDEDDATESSISNPQLGKEKCKA